MITSEGNQQITEVRVTDDDLVVALADGRTLTVPLVWYPSLLDASADERNDWRLIGDGEGIHWPQLDEDLSAAGLLRGVPAPPSRPPRSRTEQAREFFGQSMGRIKGRMQSDSAQLESIMQQLPEESQAQIQEMADSYAQFVGIIDQAAQAAGVQDVTDQAAQEARQFADEASAQGQDPADEAASQARYMAWPFAGQAQDTAEHAAGQAQDLAGQVTDQAGY